LARWSAKAIYMENQENNFDCEVFKERYNEWSDRFGEDGEWEDNAITGEETFIFSLKNGKELLVQKYKVDNVNSPDFLYSDLWFMLAKIDGKIVGFSALGLKPDIGGLVQVSGMDIAVLDGGMGIGSCLLSVHDRTLQELANKIGDIDDMTEDNNSKRINNRLDELDEKVAGDGDIATYQRELNILLYNRTKWQSIFGEEGKMGYRWDSDKEYLVKRFKKGEKVPVLDCEIKRNYTDLRVEIGIREKYCRNTLQELSKQIRDICTREEITIGDDYLGWVVQSLENGDIGTARTDFEQQLSKFEKSHDLYELLCEAMYDEETPSPIEKDRRWKKAMMEDN